MGAGALRACSWSSPGVRLKAWAASSAVSRVRENGEWYMRIWLASKLGPSSANSFTLQERWQSCFCSPVCVC